MKVKDYKSIFIDGQFPQFFDFEESTLKTFIKYYYEWMETLGPDFTSRNILEYNDIDSTKSGYDTFSQFLKNEFLKELPDILQVDMRFLIKHIKDFYKSKGTSDSLKLLFRILYNENIDVDFPGRFILRASHGKWLIEKSVTINPLVDISEISAFDFIVGANSGARAKIENVRQKLVNEVTTTEIFYEAKVGNFQVGEIVTSLLTGNEIGAILSQTTYPGKYINTDGWLSSDKKLQDNHYYQEYSYVIKSPLTVDSYRDFVQNLAHPSGTLMFGEFQLTVDLNNELDFDTFEREYSKLISYDINFYEFITLDSDIESNAPIAGKYIIIFEWSDFYNTSVDFLYSDDLDGQLQTNHTIKGLTVNYGDVEVGDVIEVGSSTNIGNGKKNFYFKVKTITVNGANTTLTTVGEYPYSPPVANTGTVKIHDTEDARISTFIMADIRSISRTDIEIKDFHNYDDVKTYEFDPLRTLPFDFLAKKQFVFDTGANNFENQNIVNNSIMYTYNNINSSEDYFFVHHVYLPELMVIRPEYPAVQSDDLNYRIINS